jgi:hypothetical protein
MSTAKLNGIEPSAWLTDVLEKLPPDPIAGLMNYCHDELAHWVFLLIHLVLGWVRGNVGSSANLALETPTLHSHLPTFNFRLCLFFVDQACNRRCFPGIAPSARLQYS